jgi:hypothetical protein
MSSNRLASASVTVRTVVPSLGTPKLYGLLVMVIGASVHHDL